jgi:hypothetical protein
MPAPTTPRLYELLRVINAATDKDTLHWTTTADEDSFRAEFGLGMVRISKVPADPPHYNLSLLDRDGTLLEEYQPTMEGELNEIDALYKKVRRQALDLDAKLKGYFNHLKKLAGES